MKEHLNLLLIIDTSGSMGEASKSYAAENLIKFIYESIDMKSVQFSSLSLYSWSKKVELIGNDIDEFIPLKYNGQVDVNNLIDFLKNKCTNDITKVLIVSDWSISRKDKNNFESWLDLETKISVRIVQTEVGNTELNRYHTDRIFHPQNIYSVIHSWI